MPAQAIRNVVRKLDKEVAAEKALVVSYRSKVENYKVATLKEAAKNGGLDLRAKHSRLDECLEIIRITHRTAGKDKVDAIKSDGLIMFRINEVITVEYACQEEGGLFQMLLLNNAAYSKYEENYPFN